MNHPIHRVTSIDLLGSYRLRVDFADGTAREIDLEPVLEGEIYGSLRNPKAFALVEIDPETRTLVWPNGADFDPAILAVVPVDAAAEVAIRRLRQGRASEAVLRGRRVQLAAVRGHRRDCIAAVGCAAVGPPAGTVVAADAADAVFGVARGPGIEPAVVHREGESKRRATRATLVGPRRLAPGPSRVSRSACAASGAIRHDRGLYPPVFGTGCLCVRLLLL